MKRRFSETQPHLVLAIALAAFAVDASGADWPQFRGPGGRAVAETANPPIDFGPESNLVWKVSVPEGQSSPIVTGERIFLTGKTNERLETVGIDRKNGHILWNQFALPERPDRTPDPADAGAPVPTPVTDGKSVYVFFGSVGLIAYDLDGKEQWRQPMAKTDLDTSASPILIGDKLIVVCDRDGGSFVEAHDKKSGAVVWRVERPQFRRGRATPFHWVHGQDEELIVAGSSAVTSYNPLKGTENWRFSGTARFAAGSPAAGKDLLFALSLGYGINETFAPDEGAISLPSVTDLDPSAPAPVPPAKIESALIAIRPGGGGEIARTHLAWKTTHNLPYGSSPLFYKGRLFTIKNGGLLSAYDAKDGRPIYQDQQLVNPRSDYWATAVATSGRIYFTWYDGFVTIINATADTPTILAQNKLHEKIVATPAPIDRTIIFRTDENLLCFGGK